MWSPRTCFKGGALATDPSNLADDGPSERGREGATPKENHPDSTPIALGRVAAAASRYFGEGPQAGYLDCGRRGTGPIRIWPVQIEPPSIREFDGRIVLVFGHATAAELAEVTGEERSDGLFGVDLVPEAGGKRAGFKTEAFGMNVDGDAAKDQHGAGVGKEQKNRPADEKVRPAAR